MANWNVGMGSKWKHAFKSKVAKRFGYSEWSKVRCCKCQKLANERYKRVMEIHHVFASIEYPELRLELDNVIPMCNKCHDIFHARYDKRQGGITYQVASANDLQCYLRLEAKQILFTLDNQ